ncbi:hypothetical protein UP09_30935 [Bradyrhizobium sp. LTSP885]|uniref:PC4/YdbC family ssDNA-binding protein n=1 Tax=Bradyrhizobium sp. LTSP885 TaxID=1619232 RepID=UPI0005C9AED2|nr:PC4/YdbC family ssDNA-binding protein [Bradyrhizobium sp. LTSP885]KJC35643.1 hypothetical protein UP09_30935 [Bradyrhizobium sp. LTSP885]
MTRRHTLDEPLEVDKFWRNRRHDAVVTSLATFEGKNIVSVRTFVMDKKSGKLVPTRKGLSILVLRLPELAKAINKALAKAQELGLLDGEAGE